MARGHGHGRSALQARSAQVVRNRVRKGLSAPELQVQVFGRRDSRDTQKALRFFRERRIKVAFVDVARKPPAPTELRRFADKLGAAALMDTESRQYRDSGLAYLVMGDPERFERLLNDAGLLKLPLVRMGSSFSAGVAEADWRSWLAAG